MFDYGAHLILGARSQQACLAAEGAWRGGLKRCEGDPRLGARVLVFARDWAVLKADLHGRKIPRIEPAAF